MFIRLLAYILSNCSHWIRAIVSVIIGILIGLWAYSVDWNEYFRINDVSYERVEGDLG